MDEAIFRAINSGLAGPVSDWIMIRVTEPSTWYIPLALLCAGLLALDRRRGALAVLAALAAVGIGDGLATHVLKPFFDRARPCEALEGVHLLAGCSQYSFPSNHAANSMAVAGALGRVFRPLLWGAVPAAALVCLSRIAVGVHYPSDVAAGAAIGFGIGWGVAYLGERIGNGAKTETEGDNG